MSSCFISIQNLTRWKLINLYGFIVLFFLVAEVLDIDIINRSTKRSDTNRG